MSILKLSAIDVLKSNRARMRRCLMCGGTIFRARRCWAEDALMNAPAKRDNQTSVPKGVDDA
ncbi:MAG: hypothetical protein ACLUKN_17690 [Bacilli bacterium]